MQQLQQPRKEYGACGSCQPNQQTGPSQAPQRPTPCDSEAVPDMDQIVGYQTVSLSLSIVPPPLSYAEEVTRPKLPAQERYQSGVQITAEQARQRLVQHAQSQCCWGTSAAKSMVINSIQSSSATHYILRTYLETRATDWVFESYQGQRIDGRENGVPPLTWDIPVTNPQFFTDKTINVEVPHSASVKTCHTCQGSQLVICNPCHGQGRSRCTSCSGSGRSGSQVCQGSQFVTCNPCHCQGRCTSCSGSGRSGSQVCHECNGTGQIACRYCHGQGQVFCSKCNGTGRLKCYIRLTVEFKTHQNDFIQTCSALPAELIRSVRGATLFEDTQQRLESLKSYPDPEVNHASQALMLQHSQLAQTGRIWVQNHVIRGVPVALCKATYTTAPVHFFVYGTEQRVFAPDYPNKCCGDCRLL